MTTPASFTDFLRDHQARVAPLEVAVAEAWWQSNIHSSPDNEARAAAAQKAITRLYADPAAYAFLRDLDPAPLAPDEARQHTLLLHLFTASQMDDAVIEEIADTEQRVETAYNSHRPLLRGTPTGENALREILRSSNDSDLRREAWEVGKQIGAVVEKDVLRLVALRNGEARKRGYTDYYDMALRLQEIEPPTLFALLDDIAAQTDDLWAEYKAGLDATLAARFGVAASDLRPWHYADPFFQEAPTGAIDLDPLFAPHDIVGVASAFFDAIGLDVRDILARSDLYERDGKSQHAFCLHVGRGDDVRVLCNCTPSERWMGTLLHELGHAVYDKYLPADLPFFLHDTAHTLTTEAIAMLLGRLSRNGAWLTRWAGVAPDKAQAVATSAAGEGRVQLLIMARWCLVMTHFERALYGDPGQDLNALWWRTVQRFQGVTPPPNRDAPDWAAKLHLALAPAYYHNYLLGEMFASQLLDYLQAHITPTGDTALVSRPDTGDYLRSAVFAHGARLPWNDLIARATGESLNPVHFVRHLG